MTVIALHRIHVQDLLRFLCERESLRVGFGNEAVDVLEVAIALGFVVEISAGVGVLYAVAVVVVAIESREGGRFGPARKIYCGFYNNFLRALSL